ncbi:hypothetical protein [Atlantibacter subterraneus]|nr:hypothetical protein [Atlantibacter subterranea]
MARCLLLWSVALFRLVEGFRSVALFRSVEGFRSMEGFRSPGVRGST